MLPDSLTVPLTVMEHQPYWQHSFRWAVSSSTSRLFQRETGIIGVEVVLKVIEPPTPVFSLAMRHTGSGHPKRNKPSHQQLGSRRRDAAGHEYSLEFQFREVFFNESVRTPYMGLGHLCPIAARGPRENDLRCRSDAVSRI